MDSTTSYKIARETFPAAGPLHGKGDTGLFTRPIRVPDPLERYA